MGQVMIVSMVLLWILVLVNFGLTVLLLRRVKVQPQTQSQPFIFGSEVPEFLKIGDNAPDFTAETAKGDHVTFATYAGQAITFLFISAHCSPCRENLSRYLAIQAQAGQSGEGFVLVITNEVSEARAFIDEFAITTPIVIATEGSNSFMDDYKAPGMPFYCSVDADGKVRSTGFPFDGNESWKLLTDLWEAKAQVEATPV
ncbi:MAG: redoxin family protein [Chloroflexota bacterium]